MYKTVVVESVCKRIWREWMRKRGNVIMNKNVIYSFCFCIWISLHICYDFGLVLNLLLSPASDVRGGRTELRALLDGANDLAAFPSEHLLAQVEGPVARLVGREGERRREQRHEALDPVGVRRARLRRRLLLDPVRREGRRQNPALLLLRFALSPPHQFRHFRWSLSLLLFCLPLFYRSLDRGSSSTFISLRRHWERRVLLSSAAFLTFFWNAKYLLGTREIHSSSFFSNCQMRLFSSGSRALLWPALDEVVFSGNWKTCQVLRGIVNLFGLESPPLCLCCCGWTSFSRWRITSVCLLIEVTFLPSSIFDQFSFLSFEDLWSAPLKTSVDRSFWWAPCATSTGMSAIINFQIFSKSWIVDKKKEMRRRKAQEKRSDGQK